VATATAAATAASLNVAKLKNIDLFQVLVGQINKLDELFGEFILCSLVVTMVRVHELFSSL
jgi:hypothetical protein